MPPASLTDVCVPMRDGLVAVTVAPGRTAPLESTILPLIDPVVLAPPPCAKACGAPTIRIASIATAMWKLRRLMNASSSGDKLTYGLRPSHREQLSCTGMAH